MVTHTEPPETDELFARTYAELRRLAASFFRSERRDHTLQPTALVHEVYLKLGRSNFAWQNREQFIATAAQAMRRVLVDSARARGYQKRGAGCHRVTLAGVELLHLPTAPEVLDFDSALTELGRFDGRKARIVVARVFGGLTVEETATAFDISPATVSREWRASRGWLAKYLSDSPNRRGPRPQS